MPKIEILVEHNVTVIRGVEPSSEEPGVMVPTWTLVFEDQKTGDSIRFSCLEHARDFMVHGLTGVVLAKNGDVPAL
jgi:hypothetical protein